MMILNLILSMPQGVDAMDPERLNRVGDEGMSLTDVLVERRSSRCSCYERVAG